MTDTDYHSIEDLENRFSYHAPKGNQVRRYQRIREAGRRLAEFIDRECPPSSEKEKAVRHIEMAVMWANAAIARNE